jgi:hypothetical protein
LEATVDPPHGPTSGNTGHFLPVNAPSLSIVGNDQIKNSFLSAALKLVRSSPFGRTVTTFYFRRLLEFLSMLNTGHNIGLKPGTAIAFSVSAEH